MSAKRKLPDEVFILKKEESVEVTKTVFVEIHEFTKRIDDVKNKKNRIECPMFKVGEGEVHIDIHPENKTEDHIGVYVYNSYNSISNGKMKLSFILKHESGVEFDTKNQVMEVGEGRGWDEFLSHVDYKKWAEDHGDVLKVECEITLHVEEGNPEPEWETIPKKRYDFGYL